MSADDGRKTRDEVLALLSDMEREHISTLGTADDWVIVRRSNPTVPRANLDELFAWLKP